MTPEEWMQLRLDTPPRVYLLRNRGQGPWQIVVRVDGGYANREDAERSAEHLGRELRWMVQAIKEATRVVDRGPRGL